VLSTTLNRVFYIKIRKDHRVLPKSCQIAIGITEDEVREIIGFMIQKTKEKKWGYIIQLLRISKKRGLQGTELVISEAHKGLLSTICKSFINTS